MGSNGENRNSYTAAETFFDAYFQKIYVEKLNLSTPPDKEIFLSIHTKGSEKRPVFQSFSKYFANKVYTQLNYTFVVDAGRRVLAVIVGACISRAEPEHRSCSPGFLYLGFPRGLANR